MKDVIELLPGALHISLARSADARGYFVKTHLESALRELGVNFVLAEEFYSVSKGGVIRGMHFQLPPHDHNKIVYCPQGRALDVLLDLRPGVHYGEVCSVQLDAQSPAILFIPRGVAHGFKAVVDQTMMIYKTSSEHAPSHDAGIRFDSFGFNWDCATPVTSDRDANQPTFAQFITPFAPSP
jgi:dTDP-4-dehydrorhamnose 3,5-epimerase